MDWLKAIQIGFYILQKINEFMNSGSSSFFFDVSYKGNPYRVTVNIARRLAAVTKAAKVF